MNTPPVDLARRELWSESLKRSQERRLRTGITPATAAYDLLPVVQRDLTDPDVWARSQWRARARREAADAKGAMPAPSARGGAVAAVLAVTGGPAVAIATGVVGTTAAAQAKPATASKGGGVSALQRKLGIGADGVFGAQTAKALKKWQRGHGMTADGIAGPATRSALGLGSGPVLKRGGGGKAARTSSVSTRSGGGVSALQRKLGIGADGRFGPQTAAAVKRWQSARGLTADGIVGPATRSAMGLGSGPVLKRGGKARSGARLSNASNRSGGGVSALQRKLGIGADGKFGPQTAAAVKRWQSARGLTADGIVGPATRSAMGLGSGPVLKRGKGGGGGGGNGTPAAVQRVINAANQIARTPYVYGGGHGSFQSSGYDCSGSVSYALRGGGLIKAPMASGALESYGAPGPGKHITVYANAGHAYMTINGRRYDTSARSETGSRWASSSRSSAGYTVRHPPGL